MASRMHRSSVCFACASVVLLLMSPLGAQTPAAQAPPPPPPNAPVPGPTLPEAQKAIAAAQAAATKIGVNLSCAVVDSRGDLIALQRMDKARFYTTDIARGKALMSAMFGQPSANFAQLANSPWFANLNTSAQGRLYPVQGAVPIMRNNQVLGAIGCSGAASQQDEDAAKAGLATFPNM